MQPNPYLFFHGDCYEAMNLYAKALGGEVVSVTRNSDAKSAEDRMPGDDDLVMNMAIKFNRNMMFGSDNTTDMYHVPRGFRLQLEIETIEDFNRLFATLSNNAIKIEMPASETFWAERFTMFTDRFGTPWMLNFSGLKS